MAKPKAPRPLTEAFRAGVDQRLELAAAEGLMIAPYSGADPACWLAHHDPKRRPCSGRMERFHFIRRETVEDAIWRELIGAVVEEPCELCRGSGCNPNNVLAACPGCDGYRTWRAPMLNGEAWEIIHVVAWDSRNAELGCEHHHRRFDGHATSPAAPRIVVMRHELPHHVSEFAVDYGLAGPLADRFPGA